MNELQQLSARALAREASRPAIEFEKRWITWGEMRLVAERLAALLDISGVGPCAPIAFVPRNRPSAIAALLGLIAKGRSMRMMYAFQSAVALARDVERLKPAVIIAAAEDFSAEVLASCKPKESLPSRSRKWTQPPCRVSSARHRTAQSQTPTQPQIEILTSGTTGPPKQFAISYDLIAKHMVGMTGDAVRGRALIVPAIAAHLVLHAVGQHLWHLLHAAGVVERPTRSAPRKVQCCRMARSYPAPSTAGERPAARRRADGSGCKHSTR